MKYDPVSIRKSYDTLAPEYFTRIAEELANKPLDRDLLRRLGEASLGALCDFGCGPGHVGEFLRNFCDEVYALDISPEMIVQGKANYPKLTFIEGDFSSLPFKDEFLGGGAAFYSLIHLKREDFPAVLKEIRRVLKPGAPFLSSFHLGTDSLHIDELWGLPISLDYDFFTTGELRGFFEKAGFTIEDIIQREPYVGFEHPSTRCYIMCRA